MKQLLIATLSVATPLWLIPTVLAAEWPQWRGPGGQGHAPENAAPPLTWSENENVTWKTEIPGRGHSSPVVDGNQIWMTTAYETKANPQEAQERLKSNTGSQPLTLLSEVKLHAVCVDVETGEILRNVHLLTRQDPQWVHKLNSYATPTPVLADGILYCHFGAYGNAALDTKSGEVLWTRTDLEVMHENGPGSSPVIWDHLMIFHLDGSDKQMIVALERATGKTAWAAERSGEMNENPQLQKSYGTPVVANFGGRDQIVSPAADWLYFYDPETGEELNKVAYGQLGFSNVARPVVGENMIYMPTGFMRSSMIAIRYDGKSEPKIAWKYDKAVPKQPSPLLVGNELYFIDEKGIAGCLDAETGEEIWRERLEGNYAASPILANGRIYFFSQEGKTVVVEPGREFKKVAENDLDAPLFATGAFAGDSIYLRTTEALYRIEE